MVFGRVGVDQSVVFCILVFCRSLFVLLSFFSLPLYCLSYDLQLLITSYYLLLLLITSYYFLLPLITSSVSSNSSNRLSQQKLIIQMKFYFTQLFIFPYQKVYKCKYIIGQMSMTFDRIDSVMVSAACSPRVRQILGSNPDQIGICCISAKHAALRRKSKNGLARNQDNVSERGNMSIRGLQFQ